MKKTVLIIAIPIVIILFSICGLFITQKATIKNIKKDNSQYEYYIDKSIYGTELVTLINTVINENEVYKNKCKNEYKW